MPKPTFSGPRSSTVLGLTQFLSFFPLGLGLLSFSPTLTTHSKFFGVPLPSSTDPSSSARNPSLEAAAAATAYLQAKGARDFAFGLALAGLAFQKNVSGLCVVMGAYGVVGLLDAWIVHCRGRREKVFAHAVGGAALMGFAAWVLETRPKFVPYARRK